MYSYRMCSDESITAKFIDPSHTPTAQEEAALEDCFQNGILSCTDVPGQDCPVHPDCVDHSDWGCAKARSWFSCGPKDNGDGSLLHRQYRRHRRHQCRQPKTGRVAV